MEESICHTIKPKRDRKGVTDYGLFLRVNPWELSTFIMIDQLQTYDWSIWRLERNLHVNDRPSKKQTSGRSFVSSLGLTDSVRPVQLKLDRNSWTPSQSYMILSVHLSANVWMKGWEIRTGRIWSHSVTVYLWLPRFQGMKWWLHIQTLLVLSLKISPTRLNCVTILWRKSPWIRGLTQNHEMSKVMMLGLTFSVSIGKGVHHNLHLFLSWSTALNLKCCGMEEMLDTNRLWRKGWQLTDPCPSQRCHTDDYKSTAEIRTR